LRSSTRRRWRDCLQNRHIKVCQNSADQFFNWGKETPELKIMEEEKYVSDYQH
jgi:hypothetical protein